MAGALQRLIIALLSIAISIGTSCLVMIHGWGLEPRSWTWIVGIYFLGTVVAYFMGQLAAHGTKQA